MVAPALSWYRSIPIRTGADPGFGRSVFIKKSVSLVEVAGTDSGSDEGGVIDSPCNNEANGFSIIFLSIATYPAVTPPTSTMRHTNSNIMDDESPRRAISYNTLRILILRYHPSYVYEIAIFNSSMVSVVHSVPGKLNTCEVPSFLIIGVIATGLSMLSSLVTIT